MRYHVLAADYDGTLATDGRIDPPTIEALRLLKESGRKLVMVTGRELDELLGLVEEPALFETERTVLTFAYYEAPSVIAAIRALGHVYNDAPQPAGYALRPFDPAREAPVRPRGAYLRTGDVARVDLTGIALAGDAS